MSKAPNYERIAAMFAAYATWLEAKGVSMPECNWQAFFWQMVLDGKRVSRECNFAIKRL